MITFLLVIIAFALGHSSGVVRGHKVVANDCEKLGRFYFGEKVFECQKIKGPDDA